MQDTPHLNGKEHGLMYRKTHKTKRVRIETNGSLAMILKEMKPFLSILGSPMGTTDVGHPPVVFVAAVAAVAGGLAAFGSDQPCSFGGGQGCTPFFWRIHRLYRLW